MVRFFYIVSVWLFFSFQGVTQDSRLLLQKAEEWHMRNPDSSIYYCNQILQNYAVDLEDSFIAKTWFFKGWNLFLKNDYRGAISSFQSLQKLANEDKIIFIRSIGRMGVAYKELGAFDSSMVYLQRYDTLVDKYIGETAIEAKLELGELYRAMKRKEQSDALKLEAVRRARKSNNRSDRIMTLYYYLDDNINDIAKPAFEEYLEEYLILTGKLNEDGTPDNTHSGMLLLTLTENNRMQMLESDISSMEGKEPTRGYLFLNRHLVWEYVKRNKFNQADLRAEKGVMAAKKIKDKAYQLDYLLLRSQIADSLNQFKISKQFLNAYHILKDSIFKADLLSRVDSLNIQFESAKKDKLIADQVLRLQRETYQKNLLTGGILFILIMGIAFGIFIRKRHQLERKVSRQESTLQKQEIKQLQNEKKLLAVSSMMEGQEAERIRIAKDLHDGLGGLLSSVKTHFNAIQSQIQALESINIYDKVNGLIDIASAEVRRISHNMAPHALQINGLKDAIQDLCEQVKMPSLEVHFEWLGKSNRLPENMEIMLFRIVQELLHNAIKYAQAKNILVQINRFDQIVNLIVEDDGIGFNYKESLEKGGLGLKSVQSRVDYLNANMDLSTELGKGTSYSIQVTISEKS
jgi:signal transduction histidine kinase